MHVGLPALKTEEIPEAAASLRQTVSPVSSSHWLPILNYSWKMNSHDRIYIAAPAVVSLGGCTAMLSITSYKFQLSPSSDKITHTHISPHVSMAIRTQSGRQQKFSDSNKIILSLNLISTTSTVDKLHSSVIKADLA